MTYIRIVVIVIAAISPFGFIGWYQEHSRWDDREAVYAAVGKAQEERTAARIAFDELLKEEADNDHQERLDSLNRELASLRVQLAHAGRGIVPAAPKPAAGSSRLDEGDAVVCFARDRLAAGVERALQRFAGGSVGSLQFGARAIATSETCSEWALKERYGTVMQ